MTMTNAVAAGTTDGAEEETVTYVVAEWRDWIKSKYTYSGWEPGCWSWEAFDTADEDLAQTKKEAGDLFGVVWRSTSPANPDAIAELEARAEHAAKVHEAAHDVGSGHTGLLKHFMPQTDPMLDLISDVTVEQLAAAVARKPARKALHSWGGLKSGRDLRALCSMKVAAVVHTVGVAASDNGITGPQAAELVNRAAEISDVLAETLPELTRAEHARTTRVAAADGKTADDSREAVTVLLEHRDWPPEWIEPFLPEWLHPLAKSLWNARTSEADSEPANN